MYRVCRCYCCFFFFCMVVIIYKPDENFRLYVDFLSLYRSNEDGERVFIQKMFPNFFNKLVFWGDYKSKIL